MTLTISLIQRFAVVSNHDGVVKFRQLGVGNRARRSSEVERHVGDRMAVLVPTLRFVVADRQG